MIYGNIAENMHFYDFVFYEVENRKMYIYCPNCGRQYEVSVTKDRNVTWLKNNYIPDDCFAYRGIQPKYKRSNVAYESLNNKVTIGEFQRYGKDIEFNVYWHTANFGLSNYCGIAFRRHPIFSYEKVINIKFDSTGNVKLNTCLIKNMNYSLSMSYWRERKKWNTEIFDFGVIEESFEQLKGTYLEQYIKDAFEFMEYIQEIENFDISINDYIIAFMVCVVKYPALIKLWRGGYKRLVLNKVLEFIMPGAYKSYYYNPRIIFYMSHQVINYKAKTLDKILKIHPSKVEKILDREDTNIKELKGIQYLDKHKLNITRENLEIVMSYRFDDLIQILDKFNGSRLFKYIRNQSNKVSSTINNVVSDYYDYIHNIKKLNNELTNDILYPTNLKISHDKAIEKVSYMQNQLKEKEFKKAIKRYKKYNYVGADYQIKVVDSIAMLLIEASNMHNCSAGYVDRIINKNSVIFVIRENKKINDSFCMLELDACTKEIVQNRGINNINPLQDVITFAEWWRENIVLQKKVS